MDDEMNTAEVLRDEAKENRTREILELMRNSKTLEEAMEKVKALLNKSAGLSDEEQRPMTAA